MEALTVLETALYAVDLDATAAFYEHVLGLQPFRREAGRHVFFRSGAAVFLLFNPESTARVETRVAGRPIPLHGAQGAGHVAFAVPDTELDAWRVRLPAHGVAIESEVEWPGGGRSIYFRDPAGNSVELATPSIWAAPEVGSGSGGS
jgi:catechol 2,3-dioxygenase-like lactoylglutathione lyase family enzyme